MVVVVLLSGLSRGGFDFLGQVSRVDRTCCAVCKRAGFFFFFGCSTLLFALCTLSILYILPT